MDIQIVGAEETPDGKHIIVTRTITEDDGSSRTYPERFPKETLAIRAAEYNLPVDDPRVLDQILLEGFYPADPNEHHPLFASETIEEAVEIMTARIEHVRNANGAPKQPQMRSLFHAADLAESTQGLTDAKALFLKHADPAVAVWVQILRDQGRGQKPAVQKPFLDQVRDSAFAIEFEKAKIEDNERRDRKPVE
jgi:hypothetical protein